MWLTPSSQELQEGPCVGQGPHRSHLGQTWGAQEERVATGRECGCEGLHLPLHPARCSQGQATRELLLQEALALCWLRRSAALAAVFVRFPVSPAWQPL